MKELIFVGLGLNDEKGITIGGLEETKSADTLFMEQYTNLLPEFSLERFEDMLGKKITVLSRQDLEEENGRALLNAADRGKVVFLVPGDPFAATTHVTLRIEAEKRGVKTRIIHGASAFSAVIGACGLHNYKFGKTVTVPFEENWSLTPYKVVAENKARGLHTLCLLDLKADENRFLSINEGIEALMGAEENLKQGFFNSETLAVGVARVGSKNPALKADSAGRLLSYDFGGPPQSLIVPGDLHFMEAETLIRFAGAPEKLREVAK